MSLTKTVVANINDFKDGEKQLVNVAESQVLLIRQNGNYSAIAAHCKHYKAPLAKGVLSGKCIASPWHNASFNIGMGDLQELPDLDSLPRCEVVSPNSKC
jgi:apoptosis-inducing factor 3